MLLLRNGVIYNLIALLLFLYYDRHVWCFQTQCFTVQSKNSPRAQRCSRSTHFIRPPFVAVSAALTGDCQMRPLIQSNMIGFNRERHSSPPSVHKGRISRWVLVERWARALFPSLVSGRVMGPLITSQATVLFHIHAKKNYW